jgi:hypothetical protein
MGDYAQELRDDVEPSSFGFDFSRLIGLRPSLSPEEGTVDGPIDREGSVDPIVAQGDDEGHGLPMAKRYPGG